MVFILLPRIKDGAYMINLYEYFDIVTHWVALYVQNNDSVNYVDSFGVEHIPKEIRVCINNDNNNNNNNNKNNKKYFQNASI